MMKRASLIFGLIALPLSPALAQQSAIDEPLPTASASEGQAQAHGFLMIEHNWPTLTLAKAQSNDRPHTPTVFGDAVTPRRKPSPFLKGRAQQFSQPPTKASGAKSQRELQYTHLIRHAERKHQLPDGLLSALIWQESRFNPLAISPAGAAGLAQLMPATAKELGVSNRHDPHQSIDGGARYLRRMLDQFGSIPLALAAYNAGPNAVKRVGGIPRNKETPGYVTKVLQRWRSLLSLGRLRR